MLRECHILTSFNPRARAGRDCDFAFSYLRQSWFQSTRPRGARPKSKIFKPLLLMFQSTRPRGARQDNGGAGEAAGVVSIHAPARGATVTKSGFWVSKYVSIHAPARGATAVQALVDCLRKFQSTRPRGARHEHRRAHSALTVVSIHAPARGATVIHARKGSHGQVSIHAPARGAT